jgi:hypothetical protein
MKFEKQSALKTYFNRRNLIRRLKNIGLDLLLISGVVVAGLLGGLILILIFIYG